MTKPSRVTRIPIDLSATLSQQRLRCAQIETSQNKSGQRESISTVWAFELTRWRDVPSPDAADLWGVICGQAVCKAEVRRTLCKNGRVRTCDNLSEFCMTGATSSRPTPGEFRILPAEKQRCHPVSACAWIQVTGRRGSSLTDTNVGNAWCRKLGIDGC